MSWHYLLGQEEASWGGTCLDGAPSALLKMLPTLGESSSPDSEMGCFQDSPSGTTSAPSTGNRGAVQLMLFRAASPARTSAQQVRVQDLPESVRAFGSRCSELLARCNLALSSRKTVRDSVPVGCPPSSKGLPAWGMTSGGACWELGTRALLIEGTEYGYWPTPTAGDARGSGSRNTKNSKAHPGISLTDAVRGDGGRGRLMPTPASTDYKIASAPGQRRGQLGDPAMGVIPAGGRLNPTWVESYLMGWPIGWTDCEPLAMDRYQEWLRWHGGY